MEPEWRRAAAYVVCRDADGRLLLTRFVQEGSPDSGCWTMPGGGMEWGESPVETASRELDEETGLQATMARVVGVFSLWLDAAEAHRGAPGHVLGIIYEAADVRGELRTSFDRTDTTDAAAWFSLAEISDLPRVPLVDFVVDLLRSS